MTHMNIIAFLILGALSLSYSSGLEEPSRDERFSIFQIIKFENAPCKGSTRNGTCFTDAECTSAGGKKDGTCADGFGVCCATIISSGGATSLNQSYIVETTPATGTYTICPCSTDVCRIRFDFTAFTLAAPAIGTTVGIANKGTQLGTNKNSGHSVGDCQTDQFSITGSAGSGTPIICGSNTGQHAFVDTDGSTCATVNLGIATTTATRSLDIMVTQYKCGDEMGGPSGCLQWFTSNTGSIRSFNFPSTAIGVTVPATVTHLSNQKYNACVRRRAATTVICYVACTQIAAAAATADNAATGQSSFGLSVSPTAGTPQSQIGSNCNTDYITIPGGDLIGTTTTFALGGVVSANNRFCGRFLDTVGKTAITASPSVCTNSQPFQVGVNFDEDEASGPAAVGTMTDMYEAEGAPGGIIGFCLNYVMS